MSTESRRIPSPEGEPKVCPECLGRGWVDHRCLTPDHAHRCMYCDGRGFSLTGIECHACKGTGLIEVRMEDKNPCPLCNGAGVYPVPESFCVGEFKYRPGMRKK